MYYNQSSGFREGFKRGGCGPGGRPFGGHGFHGKWDFNGRHGFANFRRAPVDIEETDDHFVISVYAAGLHKEAIKVLIKDDVLTISYKGSEPGETSNEERNYTHREFHNKGFERRFMLNGKVIAEDINAAYTDGILKVTLPKNPETNKPARNISVA